MAGAKRRQLGGRRAEGNFKFWILNEEEREEVAFCCDLRSAIYDLLSLFLLLSQNLEQDFDFDTLIYYFY